MSSWQRAILISVLARIPNVVELINVKMFVVIMCKIKSSMSKKNVIRTILEVVGAVISYLLGSGIL